VFGTLTLMTSGYLWANLTGAVESRRTMFLPGTTTAGHHQIESKCEACHTPFNGVTNDACLACHQEELTAADDSHPMSKFTDPRNAELLTRLDAARCATCHREHAPAMTRPIGVTLPDDYCVMCHRDIGEERPSHRDLAFTTCATAGCHNYHDNTALYEDFLVAHAGEPALRPRPQVASRNLREVLAILNGGTVPTQARLAADAGSDLADPRHVATWETAIHARAGVNCTGCHTARSGAKKGEWLTRPGQTECASCHTEEAEGFGRGRHGMRAASGAAPMTPALARLPMKRDVRGHELSCTSCHLAHDFDPRRAAVEACVGCHDDGHTRAYVGSPHHALWLQDVAGEVPAGSGVSCATCHLPRQRRREGRSPIVTVQHNQNDNLRPIEKMLRSVCLDCHGLGFSIDALAGAGIAAGNFRERPVRSVAGIDMAKKRSTDTN
jgi:hypothetical protein